MLLDAGIRAVCVLLGVGRTAVALGASSDTLGCLDDLLLVGRRNLYIAPPVSVNSIKQAELT